jgi:hypothetical protein|tara:strand:+ start:1088 stop:1930 length:843 start_codon:yes stop_codon:yes gene_type:complete
MTFNRKKHNCLVIDTETTFKNEKPFLAYNIGGAFGDIYSKDSPPETFDFYIAEILANPENFCHTFKDKDSGKRKFWKYDSRYKKVLEDAFKNRSKIKPLKYVLNFLNKKIGLADSIASYNWAFDNQAMKKTVLEYQNEGYFDMEKIPQWCIMDGYVNQEINLNYFRMVDEKDELDKSAYLSHSGKNYGYSAQCMARWIFDSEQYEERHTAEADANMEFELARHFVRKHKRAFEDTFLGNPKTVSWVAMKKKLTAKAKMEKRAEKLAAYNSKMGIQGNLKI